MKRESVKAVQKREPVETLGDAEAGAREYMGEVRTLYPGAERMTGLILTDIDGYRWTVCRETPEDLQVVKRVMRQAGFRVAEIIQEGFASVSITVTPAVESADDAVVWTPPGVDELTWEEARIYAEEELEGLRDDLGAGYAALLEESTRGWYAKLREGIWGEEAEDMDAPEDLTGES